MGGTFDEPDVVDCIDCGLLQPPENGFLDQNSTGFEAIVTYSCEMGYFLVGEESRECGINGTWSGNDPICQSEYLQTACGHILMNIKLILINSC